MENNELDVRPGGLSSAAPMEPSVPLSPPKASIPDAAALTLYYALDDLIDVARESAPASCPALYPNLCNDPLCQSIGCVADKIERAEIALRSISAATLNELRNHLADIADGRL